MERPVCNVLSTNIPVIVLIYPHRPRPPMKKDARQHWRAYLAKRGVKEPYVSCIFPIFFYLASFTVTVFN